LSVLLR